YAWADHHAWADPGDGYGYGRPSYFPYSPYGNSAYGNSPYGNRPPAPVPFAADPRGLPPPDDMLAEETPEYGWQQPPSW
ncbi:MAG: hypothetical protein J2P54_26910, partial [Bradyrhizobiaceae bacterium]|nr:hypothetical protein [Bradyrhizobiaceae bacterium]